MNINTYDTYSLRLYDKELLIFSMSNEGLEGLKTQIISIYEHERKLFPPDLILTNEGLLEWLRRRVIPKNRAFVHEILQSMGLNSGDTKGIIDVCKGLSLNDSYWVVPVNFDRSFSDYNLYENPFSEVLSLIAYVGYGKSQEVFTTSPEFTTHGMLRKAWRNLGDGIYLFKGGTEGAINAGREPYSEFYACQIAEQMGLNTVHYDLVKWKNILASKCKLFTDINTAYIPIGHIVRKGGIKACLDFYQSISSNALEDLKSMLIFDAVILNEDRHFGNFGVLMDSHTCKIKGAAPVFDNGVSLFNYAMPEDFADLDKYANTRSNPYDVSYEVICREVMGARQRAELRKLIGFRFTRHHKYNLPEEHLHSIEKYLERRVSFLLRV